MSNRARRDAIGAVTVVAAVLLGGSLVALYHDSGWHWGRIMAALLGLAIAALVASLWFSWRRIQESRSERQRRITAEAKLRDSMERFQAVLDNAPVEVYVKDLDGRILIANRRAHELFAPADGIMVGRKPHELYEKHEAEICEAQDRAIIEGGTAAHWEFEAKQGGKTRHYFTIKFPIFDAAGKVSQIGGVITDITELKERQAALRDSEERLRGIIDNTPCGIALKDTQGRCILINRWFESRLGKSNEAVRGKTAHEIFPRDFADSCVAQDQEVIRSGTAIEREEWLDCAEGALSLHTVKFPVRNSAGQIVAVGAISTDISERIRAEEEERVNRARLQAILNFSPLALYLKDIAGRLLLINKRFEEWYGISADSALGKRLSDILGDLDDRACEEQEQDVLRSGELRQREVTNLAKDGRERTTMIATFPIFDDLGAVLGTGGAEIDITELKQAQKALQAAKEAADRANAAKSRFLAAASHDLRQPLHALNLLIEALECEDEASQREAVLDAMHQATGSMGDMLNALLDISQLDAGVIKPELQTIRIGPFLEDLARTAAPRARAKGLDLRFVPSSAVVRSDRTLLARIVANLLSNAVRYTVAGKILIGCRRRAERLRIEVWDSGVGIEQDHFERIFEEYFQVGNPARDRSKGLGLGLAIVERISRILEHRVEVRSVPGRGSLFAVEVPLAVHNETADETAINLLAGARLEGSSVLLIEDDQLVMEWTARLLRSWGVEVHAAPNGLEIGDFPNDAQHPIDLIMADFRLPEGRSGLDLVKEVRQRLRWTVPAIVLTGDTSPDISRLCSEANCALLHKPIAPAKLRSLMRWLLTEADSP